MKALKVPTLLEGEALASWLELTEEEQADFKTLKKKLIVKMAPLPFTALEEFHAWKLRPGEPLPLITQDLKRLLQSAVPGLDVNAREQMLIHQFLTGLLTDISRQLRATEEAKELTKVVERACLLMTIDNQSSLQSVAACASTVDTGTKEEMSRLQNQVEALTLQVAALTTPKATNLRKRCFNCNGLGHLSGTVQVLLLKAGFHDLDAFVLNVSNMDTPKRSVDVRETGQGCLVWVPDTPATIHRPIIFFSDCGHN